MFVHKSTRKIIAMGLATVMALSSVPAMAADPGNLTAGPNDVAVEDGVGSVPVELTAEATTFDVTVPTVLPVYVDADGAVFVADDAQIINHSYGPVIVKMLDIDHVDDWVIQDHETFDPSTEKVGSQKFSMEVHKEATTGQDEITFLEANWDAIPGNGETMPLSYDAKVAPQNEELSGVTMANVIFTIGWDDGLDCYGRPMYVLTGWLESWAPTHAATLSLYPQIGTDADGAPVYAKDPEISIERSQDEGWGLWEQQFAFRSRNLYGNTYKMTIEKPGHIDYSREAICLTKEAAGDLYDESSKTFRFADSIYLFGGDCDGNGNVLDSDRSRLLPVLYGDNKWTNVPPEDKDKDPEGWRKSTLNPDSYPYVLDLNGDGAITDSDLMVISNPLNYMKWTKHYGTPTGLDYKAP